jgi:hypothetical protein
LSALVAVNRQDLIGVVVREIDFNVGNRVALTLALSRRERGTFGTVLVDRSDAAERVVGVVVHKIGRAVDGGRCPEGKVGQGEDGPAMHRPHAVQVPILNFETGSSETGT